ncbi:MAG: hypothetical protein CVV48_08030 [Spirochaetae bacterium HGW-Spirochaetae-4]|nr:MAG: hypothetical protein CVV48_08030 [Spirochaetae bacterium HGW-Spirochaetae-4]
MKRFLTLMLIVLVSASFAWAAGNAEKADDGTVTLKLFHRFPEPEYSSFINEVIADYEKMNPHVKIETISAANAPYKERIKVVLGSPESPDVFFGWVGDFTNRFIREDLVLDLTPYYDSEWEDAMMKSLVDPFYYQGNLYGMPFRVSGKAFYYNKEMFEAYNLDVPETYNELIKVCKVLESKGITPISYGNQELWPSSHYIGTLNQKVLDNDVRMKDYNPATGEFTDPGYVKALEMYQELMQYVNEFPNGLTHEMARQSFANKETAMMYLETIEVGYLEGDMIEPFDYGMFAFPDVTDGKGNQNYITGAPEGFWVSSKTKHPDIAVDFLRFLTGKDAGWKEVRQIRWFNGAKGQLDGQFNDPPIEDAYNMMLNAEGMAFWMDNELHAKLVDKYLSGVSDLTNNDTTPRKLMSEVQAIAAQLQSEF